MALRRVHRLVATAALALVLGLVPVASAAPGDTTRLSVASDGTQASGGPPGAGEWSKAPTVSSDGRYVAFTSEASNLVPGDTNGSADVFVRDRVTGMTQRVSVASS